MTPFESAVAHSRTWALLAEVLLDGWTDRALAVVDGLAWAADLPPDPDLRAARHQRVLGSGVPPYESVFRSADGLLGGDIAGQVRDAYAAMGFRPARTDIEPDHAGLQCAALSFLYAAEADALRDGVPTKGIVQLRDRFLAEHLGRWAGPFHTAVSRQGVAELTELTGLLVDLAGSARDDAAPEDLLADAKTGLKAVAAYLLVPARCGVWLGVGDIQRVAERAGLACGFGRRLQMMESLWFSAVDHGAVPALVQSLGAELDAWPPDPRIDATRAMLATLAQTAASLPADD
ncbi:MAG: molecular chaperone TorD family protein [Alphaproteobacteria bacterium]|nr:molecular chaperone TorD family protein [Alphaproteobacteria bacterium]